MTTSVKNNFLPPSLISNLQQVLATRNDGPGGTRSHNTVVDTNKAPSSVSGADEIVKPVVLVTNAEGIESPGLEFLVQALVQDSCLQVCVCAPRLLVLTFFLLFYFNFLFSGWFQRKLVFAFCL